MTLFTDDPARRSKVPALALFSSGFRPFFLGAGLYAVLAGIAWVDVLLTGTWPGDRVDPLAWHAHEMLFGFTAAAIAGFLLTAVPNWTGMRGYGGRPLILLFGLWLAGRLALSPALSVPLPVAAAVDIAFFPALGCLLLPSIIRARKRRNYVFPVLLALLTFGSALYHADALELTQGTWEAGRNIAVFVVLFMVALIGGRIVPSFTSSALRRDGRPVEIKQHPWLDRTALGLIVILGLVDLTSPGGTVAGAVALAAGIAHAARLARWHGPKTWRQPILLVLHVAYAWIPIALFLKAVWLLVGHPVGAAWLHALTIGAFATMILAVMSRAALGHTGRALVASRPVALAYILISLAAVARVAVPVLPDPAPAFALAGILWIAAFSLFSVVYAPILIGPRADRRPG